MSSSGGAERRGPHGTLYGSGSMGGTVKLVTSAPQLNTFAGAVEAVGSGTVGGGFNRGGNLMLNLPMLGIYQKITMRIPSLIRVATNQQRTIGFDLKYSF